MIDYKGEIWTYLQLHSFPLNKFYTIAENSVNIFKFKANIFKAAKIYFYLSFFCSVARDLISIECICPVLSWLKDIRNYVFIENAWEYVSIRVRDYSRFLTDTCRNNLCVWLNENCRTITHFLYGPSKYSTEP